MDRGTVVRHRRTLLDWYEPMRLAYPWRRTRDAYRVLVSELMLQQTQASRVAAPFARFVERFPTIEVLAASPRSAVVEAWAGLGYNRRAVALSRAARMIVEDGNGVVPSDPDALRSLPGVGPYTAAAVASIAFGVPVPAIDTNVRRVVRRALAGRDDVDTAEIERRAADWLDPDRPGDWNQAVMDLGRAFCGPEPRCAGCPLAAGCAFYASGATPRGTPRRTRPFAGSMRQVRGDVVRMLRAAPASTLARLAQETGHPRERVAVAVVGLVSDGIAEATPPALRGSARGRVSLAG